MIDLDISHHPLREVERTIDEAYAGRDFALADQLLRQSTLEAYGADLQDTFYHHAIKHVAEPYYRDLQTAENEGALPPPAGDHVRAYQQAAELLDFLLSERNLNNNDARLLPNRQRLSGALAEVSVFGLGARLRLLGPSLGIDFALIPSSVKQDLDRGRLSSDHIAVIGQGEQYALCPFQTKYQATPEDVEAYSVPVVSYHPNGENSLSVPQKSLAPAIRRDALGSEHRYQEDRDILDYATYRLLSVLADHYKLEL